MSSTLEFPKRGWSSQRIARHAMTQREPQTKPEKPLKLSQIKSKGECPHCGRFFLRGLHLHVLKKHKVK